MGAARRAGLPASLVEGPICPSPRGRGAGGGSGRVPPGEVPARAWPARWATTCTSAPARCRSRPARPVACAQRTAPLVTAGHVIVATRDADPGPRPLLRSHPSRAVVRRGRPHRDARRRPCTSAPSSRRTRCAPTATGCSCWASSHKTGHADSAERFRSVRRAGCVSASGSSRSCAGPPRTTCRSTACPTSAVSTRSRRTPVGGHRLPEVGSRHGRGGRGAAGGAGRRPRPSLGRPLRPSAPAARWPALPPLLKEGARRRLPAGRRPRAPQSGRWRTSRPGEGRVVGAGLGQRARRTATSAASSRCSRRSARISNASCAGTMPTKPGTAPATARASRPRAKCSRARRCGRSRREPVDEIV